jgi:hypothetical protein
MAPPRWSLAGYFINRLPLRLSPRRHTVRYVRIVPIVRYAPYGLFVPFV